MIINSSQKYIYPPLMILAILIIELSSDLYLPSLPDMTVYFQTQDHMMVMTMSLYLLGFSLLGCLSGPLSDAWGRRPVFLIGLGCFVAASWFCLNATTVHQLITARFCQGLSAGMICVVSYAIIKDTFEERACSKIFSSMGMIIALSPTLAPLIGAKIAVTYGWQMNFKLIFIAAIVGFMVPCIFLPESLPKNQRQKIALLTLHQRYLILLQRPQVLGFSLISGLMCGSIWAWIATAPFYFINVIGLSAESYSYYATLSPGAYILGTLINQLSVNRLGAHRMLQRGIILTFIGAIIFMTSTLLFDALNIILFVGLMLFGIGLAPVFSNSATLCVNVEPHYRGAASAILNLFEMSLGGLFAYLASIFNNGTLQPVAFLMILSIILSSMLYLWIIQQEKTQEALYTQPD